MNTRISPCLWFDGQAEQAANLYAATFPDSHVDAVHRAPGDYPSGKKGDVLTVEFTVLGMPFVGLNGGPAAVRVFAAMMTMSKIDVAAIEAARKG